MYSCYIKRILRLKLSDSDLSKPCAQILDLLRTNKYAEEIIQETLLVEDEKGFIVAKAKLDYEPVVKTFTTDGRPL